MTPPKPAMTRQEELQYHHRLILGLMTTLEARGLLTQTEINVIIGAARQAATPEAAQKRRPADARAAGDRAGGVPVIDMNME